MDVKNLRLMNAAGTVKGDGDRLAVLRSAVTDITFGSFTVEERAGNTGENFVFLEDGTSVNALGLPNGGIAYYRNTLPELIRCIHRVQKLVRISIAPLGMSDIPLLCEFAREVSQQEPVDTLELNLGCPNILDNVGEHAEIVAYDAERAEEATMSAREHWGGVLAVKLSPYEDQELLKQMAELMNGLLREEDEVVLSNTLPNFSPLNKNEEPLLQAVTPEGHRVHSGGMGGTELKSLVLPNIRDFRAILRPEIGITAVGGISSGEDLLDYAQAGATAFQVGTAFFQYGPRIFSDIFEQLA